MAELIHTHKGTVYAQRNGVLIPVNTDGLVGYWPMTQGSGGTAYDESKTGNDGTINGTTWTDTANGKALDFDGVDDYVKVPDSNSLDITNEITISLWFKTDAKQDSKFLLLKGEGNYAWGIYLRGNSEDLQIYITNSAGSINWTNFTGNWYDNQWHHVIGTFDGRYIKQYNDGNLEDTMDWGSQQTIKTNNYGVYLGFWNKTKPEYFDGKVDEVRIYDKALSTQEITNIYEKTRGLFGV